MNVGCYIIGVLRGEGALLRRLLRITMFSGAQNGNFSKSATAGGAPASRASGGEAGPEQVGRRGLRLPRVRRTLPPSPGSKVPRHQSGKPTKGAVCAPAFCSPLP